MPENRPRTGNSGSFKPGKSGNPGGRPKPTPRALEIRAACRFASTRAIERLTVGFKVEARAQLWLTRRRTTDASSDSRSSTARTDQASEACRRQPACEIGSKCARKLFSDGMPLPTIQKKSGSAGHAKSGKRRSCSAHNWQISSTPPY
jgi:hypothetical protein